MLATPLGSTTLTAQGAAAAAWRQDLHAWRAAATDLESARYPRTICEYKRYIQISSSSSTVANQMLLLQLLQTDATLLPVQIQLYQHNQ
jgi:hypothetical protein